VAAVAVAGDELEDRHLAPLVLGADTAGGEGLGAGGVLRQQQELLAHALVRGVLGDAVDTGELLEIAAPVFRHRLGRNQELFVKFFDVGRVFCRELRGAPLAQHMAVLHV
jgi:hypothetical protein